MHIRGVYQIHNRPFVRVGNKILGHCIKRMLSEVTRLVLWLFSQSSARPTAVK